MNEEEEKDDGLGYDKDTPMVPMFKMFVFSDVKIVLCLIFGVMSSMLAGIAMPLFIIFIGDLYNSFDPETTEKETFGELLDGFIYP
jgi:hypothetical protein